MKRHAKFLALALAALTLGGCNLVATSNEPVLINRSSVPFGLLNKTIPGTNNARVVFITQPVYIVDATGHLAPSSRIVPSPPHLASVLRELVIGPTSIETFTGYTSALPSEMVILQATVHNKIGYIDLTNSLGSLPRDQEILAIGQLVFTSYDVGATRGIKLLVAGVPTPLQMPNGATTLVATVKDYQSLMNS